MLKSCKGCGVEFETTGRFHIWCSESCRTRKRRAPTRCKSCGAMFKPSRAGHAYCSKRCAEAKRVGAMKAKTCAKCATTFEPVNGRQRFCSVECGMSPRERVAKAARTTCAHCGGAMKQNSGKQLYCSGRCRKGAWVARHAGGDSAPLDCDGEITVQDLEDAPRRLRVAKLFDLYEGAGNFEHYTTPQWVRPQDRRFAR